MSTILIGPGNAFFPDTDAAMQISGGRHPYVVLSEPSEDLVVWTNVSSSPSKGDEKDPCGVTPEEWPKVISRVSYVRCAEAILTKATSIAEAVRQGLLRPTHDLQRTVVERFQRKLLSSELTPENVRGALRH